MLKPFAVIVIVLSAITVIKNYRPEFALPLRLCVICAASAIVLTGVNSFVKYINSFSVAGGIDFSYVAIALKVTAVCIVSQTVGDICRDCSETAVATQVEIMSKLFILAVSMPVIELLLKIGIGLIN